MAWEPARHELPVPRRPSPGMASPTRRSSGRARLDFTMNHTFQVGDTRPSRCRTSWSATSSSPTTGSTRVYFAVTVSPDSKIGLDNYLWFHGLAWRLEPRMVRIQDAGIDPGIVEQNLFQQPEQPSTHAAVRLPLPWARGSRVYFRREHLEAHDQLPLGVHPPRLYRCERGEEQGEGGGRAGQDGGDHPPRARSRWDGSSSRTSRTSTSASDGRTSSTSS